MGKLYAFLIEITDSGNKSVNVISNNETINTVVKSTTLILPMVVAVGLAFSYNIRIMTFAVKLEA